MKKHTLIKIGHAFLLLTLLTGCWDRWELNELSLIVGLAIDHDDTDYILTIQAMNPAEIASQETGRGYAQAMNIQEKSKTIHESLRRMVQKSPRRAFLSQLKVLVISEEVAKDGLEHVLDFFYRDHEMRSDFYIVIARNNEAHEILDIITPLETLPSQSIFDSISFSLRSYTGTKAITIDELFQEMTAEGIEPSIMGITIEGDLGQGETRKNAESIRPKALLRNNGIAIFKNNRFLTWFSNEKSKGLDYLTGPISESVGSFSCPGGGEIALELAKYDREIDIKLIDGKPDISYQFHLITSISEVDCQSLDLSLPSSYEKVSKNAEKEFQSILSDSISATQELETDVLGVGQQLYRKHPDYWEKVRDDWDNLYKDLDIHINVEIDITDSGNIINSFSTKDD